MLGQIEVRLVPAQSHILVGDFTAWEAGIARKASRDVCTGVDAGVASVAGILQCVLESEVLFGSFGGGWRGGRVSERGGAHGVLGGGCVGQRRSCGRGAAKGVFEDAYEKWSDSYVVSEAKGFKKHLLAAWVVKICA